jgi:CRISPR/Cas system-associated exonuclease Cas4 (RecB family)
MALHLLKPPPNQEAAQLHVSYSQLFTYTMCPMKYAHNYVWATPSENRPMPMIFGKAIHAAAEQYYRCLQETGKTLPLDGMIEAFENSFSQEIKKSDVKIALKKGQSIEDARGQGAELVKLFHSEIRPQKIVAVELPFSVSVPDLVNGGDLPYQLVGYFDLVESDHDSYLIGELKTSAQKYSSLKLEFDLQPTAYSYAMTMMKTATTENSCLVRYDVLVKSKTPTFEQYFVSRTENDHQRLIQLINHVLTAIEQRIFYRNMGWQCSDCQFKTTCLG